MYNYDEDACRVSNLSDAVIIRMGFLLVRMRDKFESKRMHTVYLDNSEKQQKFNSKF